MATAVITIEQIISSEKSAELAASNPLANLWLGLLTACLGGTLICTAALVAWPLIASRFVG